MLPTENRAIIGGPGSGKTQILLHRARFLRDYFHVSAERFRIFVYNNTLKDYLRAALRDVQLPDDCLITFDQWCADKYRAHVGNTLPWDQENRRPDFVTLRAAVRQRLLSGQITLPLFDFVLVDEGQDLDEDSFALLARVSRHVTVCLDNKQQIYDTGSTEADILYKLGLRRRNISLIDAFRVCPYLVQVAAPLIPDAEERAAFCNQTRQPQTERQTPLLYFARSVDDEAVRLFEELKVRQLKGDKIAILLPVKAKLYSWAKRLHAVGVEVETPEAKPYAPKHDFSTNRPKMMTYHGAKGLTFDSVFLPRLVPGAFGKFRPERVERLVFVALTRATKWAYFSTVLGNSAEFLEKLLPLAETRQLTVQRGDQPMPIPQNGVRVPSSPVTPDKSDLDFL